MLEGFKKNPCVWRAYDVGKNENIRSFFFCVYYQTVLWIQLQNISWKGWYAKMDGESIRREKQEKKAYFDWHDIYFIYYFLLVHCLSNDKRTKCGRCVSNVVFTQDKTNILRVLHFFAWNIHHLRLFFFLFIYILLSSPTFQHRKCFFFRKSRRKFYTFQLNICVLMIQLAKQFEMAKFMKLWKYKSIICVVSI